EAFRLLASLKKIGTPVPRERTDALLRSGGNRLALIVSFLQGEACELFDESYVVWATGDGLLYSLACTPGRRSVEAVLARLAESDEWRFREFAVHLAVGQPRDVLLGALSRHQDDPRLEEFWPCLLHEMVIRGGRVEAEPAAERFVARLRERGHALAS